MSLRTKCLWIVGIAGMLGVGLMFGRMATEGASAEATSDAHCNVAGTWIGKSPNGSIFTETIITEPGGRRFSYTIEGLGINGADATVGGTFPGVGTTGLSLRGEGERIAPNTYRFKSHVYGIVDNPPGEPNEYVYIRVDEGVVHFVNCDTQQAVNNISFYTADQDSDEDGFPDPGEEPVIHIPNVPVELKRLSI